MTNHLWESTLFAALVGLVTLVMRKNAARVRHWLWLAASVKFLIPFSLLVGLGGHFGIRTAAPSQVTYVMEGFQQQLAPPEVHLAPRPSSSVDWIGPVWSGGSVVVLLLWGVRWWRVRSAVRAASPIRMDVGVKVMSSPALLEPGVFGIWRPALLLPEGIAERLTAEQLDAIVAHELCHVRRRDNLVAAIHMMVEALFWFHPLVWWIGARMVEERERACDEEVLRLGKEPEVYAEGILKVCRFYVESPIECVSGVTGSDLKKRIEEIMARGIVRELDSARKALLALAGFAMIAAPIAVGVVNAPPMHAQSQPEKPVVFEVASIKSNKSAPGISIDLTPNGRLSARGVPLRGLISIAYDLRFQDPRLTGLDSAMASERYDVEATPESGTIPPGATKLVRDAKMRQMLQTLLAERFKLKIHTETRVLPVYAVIVGKNGPKLTKAKIAEKDCPDGPADASIRCHELMGGQGRGLHGKAVTMLDVVNFAANWSDRPILDRTELAGLFEIDTEGWVPLIPRLPNPDGGAENAALGDATRPTLYMIFERLGLKMESSKAPIEMFVVEHVEKPSEN